MSVHFLNIPQVVIQSNVAGHRSQPVFLLGLTLSKLSHVENVFEPDLAFVLLELRTDTGKVVYFFESVERQYEHIRKPMEVKSLCSLPLGLAVRTLPFVFDHLFLAIHLQAILNGRLNQHHLLLWVVSVVYRRIGVHFAEIKIFAASHLDNQRALRLEVILIV